MRLVLVAFALLFGCATPPPPKPPAAPSLRELLSTLVIGQSTKSDVRAALGEGTVLSFDSGYDVWVYRQPRTDKAPAIEVVLLFEPTGVLSRARAR